MEHNGGMRRIFSLLLFLLTSIAVAQPSVDTYGKTEAQILQMGQEKWFEFYTSKAGESTAGMADAYRIYGGVAAKRNDRIMKSSPNKSKLQKLRKLLDDFSEQTLELCSNINGGGTMYIPMYAQYGADAEDTLYAILAGKGRDEGSYVVSDVKAKMDALFAKARQTETDKEASYFRAAEAHKSITALRNTFKEIVSVAKKMSRRDSDLVLGYCLLHADEPFRD